MPERLIETPEQRTDAINAIAGLELPYRITISPKKERSNAQNNMWWSALEFHICQIAQAVTKISDYTGHTPLEIRRMIALQVSPEQSLMIYALKKEALHEALKLICCIPTSTRLGTKKFSEFHGVMEMEMANLMAEVNGFMRFKE